MKYVNNKAAPETRSLSSITTTPGGSSLSSTSETTRSSTIKPENTSSNFSKNPDKNIRVNSIQNYKIPSTGRMTQTSQTTVLQRKKDSFAWNTANIALFVVMAIVWITNVVLFLICIRRCRRKYW